MAKQAVCVYIEENGKVLSVSRKDDHGDFGLPGGKVEGDETLREAAIREAKEETGLDVYDLEKIFVRDSDVSGFICTTFSCNYRGEISSDEAGKVAWLDHSRLFDGTFGDYNRALHEHLLTNKD